MSVTPAPSFPRVFRNVRDELDGNTCGQAAIATLLAYFSVPRFADAAIDDAKAIDRVRDDFGPDVPLGFGTTAFRIAAALRHHGLEAEIVHSGAFASEIGRACERLSAHLARGISVPVCVVEGALGGPAWAAHWAVALRLEDGRIVLGNSIQATLELDRFLAAWRCRQLPWPHHHCAVLAER